MKITVIMLLFLNSILFGATISEDYEIDNTKYEECIEYIKSCEGFRSKAYKLSNYKYIGYGHLIRKNEYFDSISETKATMILKDDLNRCIDFMYNKTKLKSNKLLAISLLSYNIGVGKVCRYIKEHGILKDYSKTLNYCNYRVGEVVKHSYKLKQRRLFEYNLWTNE